MTKCKIFILRGEMFSDEESTEKTEDDGSKRVSDFLNQDGIKFLQATQSHHENLVVISVFYKETLTK